MVPTHNHLELTAVCIERLYQYTEVPFHLIIIDDSTDATVQHIENLIKEKNNITFIHSDVPYKCGNQIYNVGFKHCKTPYMATVMYSMEVEPEWARIALRIMDTDGRIATIALKSLFARSGLIECAGIYMFDDYLPVDFGKYEPSHRLNSPYQCEATQWAFAIHRVEALKGNLDETLFNGFVGVDDIDNCFVLRHKGWRIIYTGLGIAYHHPRATRGKDVDDVESLRLNGENFERFCKRWGYWENFHRKNLDVPEYLGEVEFIADGVKMREEEMAQGEKDGLYGRYLLPRQIPTTGGDHAL